MAITLVLALKKPRAQLLITLLVERPCWTRSLVFEPDIKGSDSDSRPALPGLTPYSALRAHLSNYVPNEG